MAPKHLDTVDLIHQSIRVKDILMEHPSVIESIGKQYLNWHPKHPVFIDAPTGSGKTTFVYKELIQTALSQNQNVLLVSNRIALSLQQKESLITLFQEIDPRLVEHIPKDAGSKDAQDFTFVGPVCVTTYQGLFSTINNAPKEVDLPAWLSNLQYAVFDEVHFLYSDALFNSSCGFLLRKIPVVFSHVIRIYMTATSWEVINPILNAEREYRQIRHTLNLSPAENFLSNRFVPNPPSYNPYRYFYYYHRKADYSSYRLHCFDESQYQPNIGPRDYAEEKLRKKYLLSLLNLMSPPPSPDNKWLIFVDKKNSGEALYDVLLHNDIPSAYIDSKTKKPLSAWNKLVKENRIDQSVLIATSVLECGVNIIDPAVKNIAILCTDRTSFIQHIGRKRRAPDETIDLWVWIPSKEHFEGLAGKINNDLSLAYDVLQKRAAYKKDPAAYATKARELWERKDSISCTALFYIDNDGLFNVNHYVLRILQHRLDFIHQFTHEDGPQRFQNIIEEWLGITGALEEPSTFVSNTNGKAFHSLLALLEENIEKPLSKDDFKPIRKAILSTAKQINALEKYIPPQRAEHLSAKTLNSIFLRLDLPYIVSKQANMWTIFPLSPES